MDEIEKQPNDWFIGKELKNQSYVNEESNVETEEDFCSNDCLIEYYLRVFDKNANNNSKIKPINDKLFKY